MTPDRFPIEDPRFVCQEESGRIYISVHEPAKYVEPSLKVVAEVLTRKEAARELGVSSSRISQLIKDGTLDIVGHIGPLALINASAVRGYPRPANKPGPKPHHRTPNAQL